MLHLIKLAGGVKDFDSLAAAISGRGGIVAIRTRNFPKRASEILNGGSMYWVAGGAIVGRQRILDIVEDTYEDGSPCARIEMAAELIKVERAPRAAFQGWRYLEPEKAPTDIPAAGHAEGIEALPEKLRRELRDLALI